jgi:hypothetical protein
LCQPRLQSWSFIKTKNKLINKNKIKIKKEKLKNIQVAISRSLDHRCVGGHSCSSFFWVVGGHKGKEKNVSMILEEKN